MERKIDVIDDFNGRKIVFIHDIIFKKKQYVEWKDVKAYLKKYVGEVYKVLSVEEKFILEQISPMNIQVQHIHIPLKAQM